MKIINWKRDLGSPAKPGEYFVKRIKANVIVTQRDIDSSKLGDDRDVAIDEITSQGPDNDRTFILGQFIPQQNIKNEILNLIKK